jgi:PEP-CTERM motif
MLLRCCLALTALTLSSAAAWADTLVLFELNATFKQFPSLSTSYQVLTGPITIDTTNGTVTATDLTLTVYDDPAVPLGSEEFGGAGFSIVQGPQTYVFNTAGIDSHTYYRLDIFDPSFLNYLDVDFPVASLVGYSGGPLCGNCPIMMGGPILSSLAYNFDGLSSSGAHPISTVSFFLQEGTLTPEATAVPEPSTFALIGTGVIGFAGAFCRQRLVRHGVSALPHRRG